MFVLVVNSFISDEYIRCTKRTLFQVLVNILVDSFVFSGEGFVGEAVGVVVRSRSRDPSLNVLTGQVVAVGFGGFGSHVCCL